MDLRRVLHTKVLLHMQLDQAIKRLQQQNADLEQQQATLSQQIDHETSRKPDAVRCQACADPHKELHDGALLAQAHASCMSTRIRCLTDCDESCFSLPKAKLAPKLAQLKALEQKQALLEQGLAQYAESDPERINLLSKPGSNVTCRPPCCAVTVLCSMLVLPVLRMLLGCHAEVGSVTAKDWANTWLGELMHIVLIGAGCCIDIGRHLSHTGMESQFVHRAGALSACRQHRVLASVRKEDERGPRE